MYLLDSVMSIGEALNVSITGIVVVFIVLGSSCSASF